MEPWFLQAESTCIQGLPSFQVGARVRVRRILAKVRVRTESESGQVLSYTDLHGCTRIFSGWSLSRARCNELICSMQGNYQVQLTVWVRVRVRVRVSDRRRC